MKPFHDRFRCRIQRSARAFGLSIALGAAFVGAGPGRAAPGPAAPTETQPKPTLGLKESSVVPKDWGTTYSGTIRSEILGAERTVDIYVPSTFARTKRTFPVLYLTD